VPGLFSQEALLVLVQGCLLVSRTLLTDWISRMEGYCGSALTSLVRVCVFVVCGCVGGAVCVWGGGAPGPA
jgi:hypothetical protein